jgi:hypothetical protein
LEAKEHFGGALKEKVHRRKLEALEKYKCYIDSVIAEPCNGEIAMKNKLFKQEVDCFTVDLSQ